jgi:hypothetical protein
MQITLQIPDNKAFALLDILREFTDVKVLDRKADTDTEELPQWQQQLIDERLAQHKANPNEAQDWDTIAAQFDKEDEAI